MPVASPPFRPLELWAGGAYRGQLLSVCQFASCLPVGSWQANAVAACFSFSFWILSST